MKTSLKTFPNVHEYFYRKQVHDWKESLETELHFLLETTKAENEKLLENVDEDHPKNSSEEKAKLSLANWNNGYASAIEQVLGLSLHKEETRP